MSSITYTPRSVSFKSSRGASVDWEEGRLTALSVECREERRSWPGSEVCVDGIITHHFLPLIILLLLRDL